MTTELSNEEVRVKIAEILSITDHKRFKFWFQSHGGWKWWLNLDDRTAQRTHEIFGTPQFPLTPYDELDNLPNWPTDPAAALQLCDRMHSEGWSYTITRYPERTEHFVTFGKPEHEGHHASDPSLARAVTLCFLAAHSNER